MTNTLIMKLHLVKSLPGFWEKDPSWCWLGRFSFLM